PVDPYAAGERAACSARQDQLALRHGRVEAACRSRRVAQLRIACPEPDARRSRLVRVLPRIAERRPAPRPDAVDLQLTRHLLRRERLELDDLEPCRPRLQSLAPSLSEDGLELQ